MVCGCVAAAAWTAMAAFQHEWPTTTPHRVAIVGVGSMGQEYLMAYDTFPDCTTVALVDASVERAGWLAERFFVAADALYTPDRLDAMLTEQRPDVVCVVTPVMYMKQVVLACCEAESVRAIQCEKPLGGRLADVDEMVTACKSAGKIFGAGNTQRCIPELQELASRLHSGVYGRIVSATLHGFGGEIVGGGCQALSVLRLLTGAEVTQVNAYRGVMSDEADQMRTDAIDGGHPQPFDAGLQYSASLTLSTGLVVPCFPVKTSCGGVDVLTSDGSLLRWDWPNAPDEYTASRAPSSAKPPPDASLPSAPQVFQGVDQNGARIEVDPQFADYKWKEHFCEHASSSPLPLHTICSYSGGFASAVCIFASCRPHGVQPLVASHDGYGRKALVRWPRPPPSLGDLYRLRALCLPRLGRRCVATGRGGASVGGAVSIGWTLVWCGARDV